MPFSYITNKQNEQLAYVYDTQENASFTIVYFNGFHSQLFGEKSQLIRTIAMQESCNALFFDYQAHGASSGEYAEASLKDWLNDSILLINQLTNGPLLFIASSMGAWLSLLTAEHYPDRMKGILCISAACDFTTEVIDKKISAKQKQELDQDGLFYAPTKYDEDDYVITQRLIDEGRELSVLNRDIAITCPVRLLHGNKDLDIPWEISAKTLENIQSANAQLILIKDADHQLSSLNALQLIKKYTLELIHV